MMKKITVLKEPLMILIESVSKGITCPPFYDNEMCENYTIDGNTDCKKCLLDFLTKED